jgi:hypothetical protein
MAESENSLQLQPTADNLRCFHLGSPTTLLGFHLHLHQFFPFQLHSINHHTTKPAALPLQIHHHPSSFIPCNQHSSNCKFKESPPSQTHHNLQLNSKPTAIHHSHNKTRASLVSPLLKMAAFKSPSTRAVHNPNHQSSSNHQIAMKQPANSQIKSQSLHHGYSAFITDPPPQTRSHISSPSPQTTPRLISVLIHHYLQAGL